MAKGRKIFVSYKYGDTNVDRLSGHYQGTARDYVDYLIKNRLNDEIYKGEGHEDLSEFKDETIKTRLKDKIHDSSITLVLISPNMKDDYRSEKDQWIPWEISYSLKEITRNDRTSHTNAILAVVLPDRYGDYSYFMSECNKYHNCNTRFLATGKLFQILRDNMFNYRIDDNETYQKSCQYCSANTIYSGKYSYIDSVKWSDFNSNKDHYLEKAIRIRDNRKAYNITKEIK